MKAIATAEFLNVIPAAIRQRLRLEPGTVLDFDEKSPWIVAKPVFDIEEMMSCIGTGKGGYNGLSSSEWLDNTRGPVDFPSE